MLRKGGLHRTSLRTGFYLNRPAMSSSVSPSANILRQFWGITAAPERVSAGVSRDTWRTGEAFWLTYLEAGERARFRRDAELLRALPFRLKSLGAAWTLPEVVPTNGEREHRNLENLPWRMTRHVHGKNPTRTIPEPTERWRRCSPRYTGYSDPYRIRSRSVRGAQ